MAAMPPLYPLTFRPVFKRYLWGGRRLEPRWASRLARGTTTESWEITDHEHGQSIVAEGPLAGTSLHELVVTRGDELFGRHAERHGSLQNATQPRFPLISNSSIAARFVGASASQRRGSREADSSRFGQDGGLGRVGCPARQPHLCGTQKGLR